MKRLVWVVWSLAFALLGLSLLPATVSALTLPEYRFTKSFDASGGSAFTWATAVDASGNAYVAGYFTGSVNFAGSGGSDVRTAGSGNGAYLTKYKNDGTYQWTKTFDVSAGEASAYGVATDRLGNIFLVGDFTDTVIFDGAGGSDSVTQTPSTQGTFVTKFNADGSYGWTKTFDVSAGQTFTTAAAADSHGNVYVIGSFLGTITPGGSDTLTDGSSDGNVFTAKFNANGTYAWAKAFDSTNGSLGMGMSLAVDASDNVYAGGVFSGTMIFDGPGGSDSATELTGDGNTFITEYGSDGSYKSTKTFDTSPGGYSYGAQGLAVDTAGNLYTVGAISGTVNIGSDTRTANLKGAVTLVKYNPDGSYGWSKTLSDAGGWSDGHAVATDSLGDVYVTGEFYQTVTFDGSNDPHTSVGIGSDMFLTKYNPDGSYAWTRTADTTPGGQTAGFGLAADSFGNVFIGSFLGGSVIFDGPGGSDMHDGGSISSGALTSFAAFIPAPASTSKPAATPAKTVAAVPDTAAMPVVATEPTPAVTTTDNPNPVHDDKAQPVAKKSRALLYILIAVIVAFIFIVWAWYRKRDKGNEQLGA